MALMSPRFVNKSRLVRASNGETIKKGSRGSHVHLIQMALIDLGHPMPRSVGGSRYSPDGIYGDETVEKVCKFQTSKNLSTDGEVGKNTMAALDNHFRTYNHRVKLHFRSISLAIVPFQQSFGDAIKVYGQYGIKIEFASGQSLGLSRKEEQKFNRVDGNCNWLMNSGEFYELHALGGRVPSNEILVYYVQDFGSSIVGCGGHSTNRPACTIAANGTRWTTAHELGHVLQQSGFRPVHMEHTRNLMYRTTTVHGTRRPVLSDRQVIQMRKSPCCIAM